MTAAKTTSTLELSLSSSLQILLLVGFSCPKASGCDLLYLKAPPSRLECNPYSQSAQLKLECQVQTPASVRNRVEIQWFYNDTSQATRRIDSTSFPPPVQIDIGNQTSMDGDGWKLTSSITISDMSSPAHQGMYFCQVALDGNTASLSPSSSILLEDEDEGESGYLNLHPCDKVFVEDTMRCAGNIPSIMSPSSPSSSATSVPTTSSATITVAPLQTTTVAFPSTTNASRGNPTLNLWVYVLVPIAAVFGMMIVVLTIFCVGLCLKKNKMTDSFKHVLNDKTGNTMVRSELHELAIEKPPEADVNMMTNEVYAVIQDLEPDYEDIS